MKQKYKFLINFIFLHHLSATAEYSFGLGSSFRSCWPCWPRRSCSSSRSRRPCSSSRTRRSCWPGSSSRSRRSGCTSSWSQLRHVSTTRWTTDPNFLYILHQTCCVKFVPTISDSIISLDIDLITTDRAVHIRLVWNLLQILKSIFILAWKVSPHIHQMIAASPKKVSHLRKIGTRD